MNDFDLLQINSFYLGAGGLAAGAVIIFMCGLLRLTKWSPAVARGISRILAFLGMLTAAAIMLGFGGWIWLDELTQFEPQQVQISAPDTNLVSASFPYTVISP